MLKIIEFRYEVLGHAHPLAFEVFGFFWTAFPKRPPMDKVKSITYPSTLSNKVRSFEVPLVLDTGMLRVVCFHFLRKIQVKINPYFACDRAALVCILQMQPSIILCLTIQKSWGL